MRKLTGVVQRGENRGNELGFPTANIPLGDSSLAGIYVASVIVDGKEYDSAVFIDTKRKLLEAHLLDFSGELYDKRMNVQLFVKIRENERFNDDNELKEAIARDVQAVRDYFASRQRV